MESDTTMSFACFRISGFCIFVRFFAIITVVFRSTPFQITHCVICLIFVFMIYLWQQAYEPNMTLFSHLWNTQISHIRLFLQFVLKNDLIFYYKCDHLMLGNIHSRRFVIRSQLHLDFFRPFFNRNACCRNNLLQCFK